MLRPGIGGHDPGGDVRHRRPRKRPFESGQTGFDAVHWVLAADYPGGGDEYLTRRATQCVGHRGDHPAGVVEALIAGSDVGVLGDHDHRPSGVIGDVLTGDHDARPGESTLGEHSGRNAWTNGGNNDEVVCGIFDADVGDVGPKSLRQIHVEMMPGRP